MNMRTNSALLILCALAAAGCGGTRPGTAAGSARPAWLDGESPRWPRARYIVGVGSADDEAGAAERARGEIARVFSTDVKVDTSLDEQEVNVSKDGASSSTFSQDVRQRVATASRKALEGADVVERWRDGATGRHYALAALPKDQALLAVAEKLHALDQEAAGYKSRLDAASGRFDKAKAAARLAALLEARAELEAEHRVLGGGSHEGKLDAGAAKAAAAAALAALNVVVAAEGDGAAELTTGLVAGLNAAGLSAKPASSGMAADMLAEADLRFEPVAAGDPRWKWSRAVATVSLKEGREGKVFSRFDLSERQASADAGEARRRALAGLSKKAAEKTEAAIRAYFEN